MRRTTINLSEATDRQIEFLARRGFGSFTQIVRLAIDRMYAKEFEEMKDDYWQGFDDGHDGNYANPYDKETLPDAWLAYKTGFEAGEARFMAGESTPLNEQLALAEEGAA